MSGMRLPPAGWLPVATSWRDGMLWVEWSDFGQSPLHEPFFHDEVQKRLRRPFNRLFRHATPITLLPDCLAARRHLQPDGFIFHMSRCGSTLVAQMLRALPGSIVISEAGPIDGVLDARNLCPDLSEEEQVLWLRWMIGVFGQVRRGDERHYVVKFDCWHTVSLALLTRAFPDVPWIFVYRDPVEVLVSHLRQPGMQMIPALVAAERFDLDPSLAWQAPATYQARVLARICEPVLRLQGLGGGCLVNYRQLPSAVSTLIMPHFGIIADDGKRDILAKNESLDAKRPGLTFVHDSILKQLEASPNVRELARIWLEDYYERFEDLRLDRAMVKEAASGMPEERITIDAPRL